jgi:hypothetical protein
MDIPQNHKPTREMKFAAIIWVLIALAVILFTDPGKSKSGNQRSEKSPPHFGAMFEIK